MDWVRRQEEGNKRNGREKRDGDFRFAGENIHESGGGERERSADLSEKTSVAEEAFTCGSGSMEGTWFVGILNLCLKNKKRRFNVNHVLSFDCKGTAQISSIRI